MMIKLGKTGMGKLQDQGNRLRLLDNIMTCRFCLQANNDWSNILARPSYYHSEAKYAAVLCSFLVQRVSAVLELKYTDILWHDHIENFMKMC